MEKDALKIDYSKLKIFEEYNAKDIKFPMILSVPHAGRLLPPEFVEFAACCEAELRENEDSYVDEIVRAASDAGIPMLAMNIARSFVDVNRDKIELDPAMFADFPADGDENGGRKSRVGLGVIHRITVDKKPIYNKLLSYDEVLRRFKHVYDPYHKRLAQLVAKAAKKFGFCLVLDCHSMPSKICSLMGDSPEIQLCIGTMFGQSAPEAMYHELSCFFKEKGYNVALDCPYSGAFITFNYCQPRKKVYTLQLEMNRRLYMDERSRMKNKAFGKVSEDVCAGIISLGQLLGEIRPEG